MKCVIPSTNLKTFGKAIQSLAKVGDEISLEPTLEGLQLKAVNCTRSCMAFYEFKPRFFQHYDDGSPRPVDQNSTPRFRLTAKCCLNVFKSLNNIDKLVEYCKISLSESQCRVVFSLHCKHGIVKNYNLTYMEADPLNCALTKGSCSSTVKAESKLYAEIVGNFPNSLEELTMLVKPRSMSVRNYVDGQAADPLKSFSTTMTLDRDEFDTFQVKTEASISFCLKEVKAALSFADFTGLAASLHFDEPGKPMFINIDDDPTFEMTFIISTISEDMSQPASASQPSAADTSVVHNTSDVHNVSSASTSRPSKPKASATSQQYLGRLPKEYHNAEIPQRKTTQPEQTKPSVSSKHSSSAVIHNNTSAVEVKPKLGVLMNDTSISLLRTTNQTISDQPRDDIDQLLKEIDDESRMIEPATKRVKAMFFNKRPVAKPAVDTQKYLDEILAEDSDDD